MARAELVAAIERGLAFLQQAQNSNGWWSTPDQPAVTALRSYGSMSYGGLLSYIYAQVSKEDPRVIAVLGWLRNHYTVEENPALGQQGYYYYLHLLVKALSAAGEETFRLADGATVAWREQVAARLLRLQQADGSWLNREPRWWESDPILVTSYAVLTLELLAALGPSSSTSR